MMHSTLIVSLFTAALLGFRHGFDYDHIAAITDVVSVQSSRRTAMKLGMTYALGHALMVALLGLAVIVIGVRLPASVDLWAERLVGLTLLVLGGYILATLFRPGDHIPKSRYMLLHKGIYRVGRLVSFRRNGQDAAQYVPPPAFDARSIFFVGIVHGLGAETPSQLMIFLLAVHLGGTFLGIVGLGTFIAGLLIMNTLMTASAAGVFGAAHDRPIVRRTLFAFTGIYSFAMGVLFIGGRSFLLP